MRFFLRTLSFLLIKSTSLPDAAAHFEFMRQAVVFVLLLAALAVLGFVINVKALVDACASIMKIIFRGFDMVRQGALREIHLPSTGQRPCAVNLSCFCAGYDCSPSLSPSGAHCGSNLCSDCPPAI